MPYVQSHTTLRLHPKTTRLRAALSRAAGQPVPRYAVVGWLHLLWHWTLEYSPWGDLSRYSAAEIADAAEWPHDPDAFVAALEETGWLDPDTHTVHDWPDYAGEMLRKRAARAALRAAKASEPAPFPPSPPRPLRSASSTSHPQEPAGFAGIRALRERREQR